MPAIFHPAGSGAPECLLLLLKPEWPIDITYSLESEQGKGLTGVEYRTPRARAIRHRMSWSCLLTASEADSLRKALAQLGDKRVGVPLWVDAYCAPAGWIHAPQRVVSWNGQGGYVISVPGVSYVHANVAPLLVGRLEKRPLIKPIGKALWAVEFEVLEDSPWACRLEPASGYVPTSFLWDPDWSEIIEHSEDQLRKAELGDGRESGIAGGVGSARWGQEAQIPLFSRNEIGDLLRFWADRQGSVKTFPVPAWCQAGTGDSNTPDNYVARFDKDIIELSYETPVVAGTKLLLWQEVATGSDQAGPATSHLYTFTWDEYPATRLTAWEHELLDGATLYAPAKIAHDDLRRTLSPVGDECTVMMFEGEAINPMQPLVSGEAERRLQLEIVQVSIDPAGTILSKTPIFSGTISSAEIKDDMVVGNASTMGGIFNRRLPRFYIQKGCNYTLGDACCKVAKSSIQVTGVVTGTGAASEVWFHASPSLPAAYLDKWFAGGWIEVVGWDGSRHRRAILDCFHSATLFHLQLNRPLPVSCEGASANAFPGCSGDYSMCIGKFANGANFGGFPFLAAYLSTSNGNGSSPKAK